MVSADTQGEDKPPESSTPAKKKPRARRTRGVIAWILIVLTILLVPLSVVTVWAINTTTNTDKYVETLAPIARNKVITDYVALRATDKLFASVPIQSKLDQALPKPAKFIAAPVTTQLKTFVQARITKLLESTWFHNLWDRANRRTHAAVVAVLTGKGTPRVKKANDVIVNITPVLDKAIDQLDARGVTIFNPVKQRLANANTLTVKLMSDQQISKSRHLFRIVTELGWAIPLVTVLIILAGILIAVDRRKTLLRMAVGAALSVLLFIGFFLLGAGFFSDHAGRAPPQVALSLYSTIFRYVIHGLKVVLLVCVLVAIVLWLAGPSSWARWIRAKVGAGARWLWSQIKDLGNEKNRAKASSSARKVGGWIVEHSSGLRIVGVVVAGIILVFGGNLSISGVWFTFLGLVIYLVLLQVVVIWARRVAPPSVPASAESDDKVSVGAGPDSKDTSVKEEPPTTS